ncbi:response regulator transcription factor [Clostridium beijerinckii]|uniref:Stage 0 sporulation protein A homolog n=1 Tax=Clostridium beijerinckii TaxID=1520 RepID=A0AAW3W6M2_CLOBE|nr:response regulator transcription factor [Clostridium beijerinckii]MBC2456292.1 response regulator transcription factor [Clostridium beijerinckii]MBC2474104.1 response regulator transcription factor [Clostridium beijerinckii]MDG5853268.1 response regulator transcription factor [Clostridium beijerinckii]NOV62097.1 DNA-binding response OmpR family regulator [Clostridium beijerinckii]NOV68407.1 DNA-binding response OmpR family regulator [Clostridium beijerinckii]
MKQILIIEDDINIAELEKEYLQLNGYKVEIIQDGIQGLKKALIGTYDLIIVDLMLPGKDGYEIVREVREKYEIPIIIVSARSEDIDKIKGLGFGADDYLTKPFSPAELVARIKSHMLRYERLSGNRSQLNIISHKALEIRTDSHKVFVNGKEVILTTKEYELMVFLASNPNIVFTKDQLFDRIWGEDYYGDTATVAVHIQKLRKKIEKDPGNPEYIETLWGTGYRFNS